jgi:NAD(P)-dependent dehydrogenase (short-subunit alcohol dehydrogenase family)
VLDHDSTQVSLQGFEDRVALVTGGARGITANVVAPRNIRTPMIAGLEDELIPRIPTGRLGEPDDVAAAVAFLSSAHASYITGEVVVLNGGWW